MHFTPTLPDNLTVRIRIVIQGRDDFWRHAFDVEWLDQFPGRSLTPAGEGLYLAESEWFEDLERVGRQTFCTVLRAPDNPLRRRWFNSIFPSRLRD